MIHDHPDSRGSDTPPAPPLLKRLSHGLGRVLRRRFFRVVFALAALLVMAVVALLGYVFRPTTVNNLVETALADLLADGVRATFDAERTEVSFPSLDTTGVVRLFNLRVESITGEYTLLHVPEIEVNYNLLGLPRAPVTSVTVHGVYAALNVDDDGNWVDQAILRPQPDDEPSELPDLLLPDVTVLGIQAHFRLPSVFVEPPAQVASTRLAGKGFSWQGHHAYYLSGINAWLRQSPSDSGRMQALLEMDCDYWGKTTVSGSVGRALNNPDLKLAVTRPEQPFTREVVELLTEGPGRIIDLFFAHNDGNMAEVSALLTLDSAFALEAEVRYRGSGTFLNVPLVADDLSGVIRFDGDNLHIVNIVGSRAGAEIKVNGTIGNLVSGGREAIDISIEARNLLLTPQLHRALTGERLEDGSIHYPEWEAVKRRTSPNRPNPPAVLDRIISQLAPTGLVDLLVVITDNEDTGGTNVEVSLAMLDVSASFRGTPEPVVENLIDVVRPLAGMQLDSLNSVKRLESPTARSASAYGWKPGLAGFPLPLYHISGVLNGNYSSKTGGTFATRGFREDEIRLYEGRNQTEAITANDHLVAQRLQRKQQIIARNVQIRIARGEGNRDQTSVRIEIATPGVTLDHELFSLMPDAVRQGMTRLDFGAIGIDVRDLEGRVVIDNFLIEVVDRAGGASELSMDLDISLDGVQGKLLLEPRAAPLPLNNLSARVGFVLARNLVEVREVRATTIGGASVLLNNLVMESTGNDTTSLEMAASISNLTIGEELLACLPRQYRELIRQRFTITLDGGEMLDLSGSLDVQASLQRNVPGQADLTVVRATLRDLGFQLADLRPLRFIGGTGVLELRIAPNGTTWQAFDVQMSPGHDPSPATRLIVSADGSLLADGAVTCNAQVTGRQILLAPELRQLADRLTREPESKGESQLATIWRQLEPGGNRPRPIGRVEVAASLSAHFASSGAPTVRYLADISLKGGELTYAGFPLPLVDVESRVTLSPGTVLFSGLKAKVAPEFSDPEQPSSLSIANIDIGSSGVLLAVAVRDLQLGKQFGNAIPANLRDVYDNIRPTGFLTGTFKLQVSGSRIDYRANAELKNTSLSLGIEFTDCNGIIDLTGAFFDPAADGSYGEHVLLGQVELDSMKWNIITLNNVRSSLQFADNRFVLPNLRAETHKGKLKGQLTLNTGDNASYYGKVVATGVSLENLTSDLAWAKGSDQRLRGGLDAELEFYTAGPDGMLGRGRIDVGREPLPDDQLARLSELKPEERQGPQASLGDVPIFGGLYNLLQLEAGEFFNEAHMIFHMHTDRMVIRQLNLISDAVRVESSTLKENYMRYQPDAKGQQIELVLVPTLFPRMWMVPGVQEVLDGLKGLVLRVYINGTLDQPVVGVLTRASEGAEQQGGVYPDYSPPDE